MLLTRLTSAEASVLAVGVGVACWRCVGGARPSTQQHTLSRFVFYCVMLPIMAMESATLSCGKLIVVITPRRSRGAMGRYLAAPCWFRRL